MTQINDECSSYPRMYRHPDAESAGTRVVYRADGPVGVSNHYLVLKPDERPMISTGSGHVYYFSTVFQQEAELLEEGYILQPRVQK